MVPRLVLSALLASATVFVSCSTLEPCDVSNEANPLQDYNGGMVDRGVYTSSSWSGPLLTFPGGQRYRIVHRLGRVPSMVVIWVSFSEHGIEDSDVALASGNMAVVQELDDQAIVVKNETCSDMYVLVTATAGSELGEGDAGQVAEGGQRDGD